jgi:acrylyl-CoA reductase (NADPH)
MTSCTAFVAERRDDAVDCRVTELAADELGDGDVLVRVEWSGVNYKDALATQPKGGVARLDRLVPGIDLAGEVEESGVAEFEPGDRVIAHGYGLGVSHHGGFGTVARVPADWLVPLPTGLDPRAAMTIGTAGFTAALSIERLEHGGLEPGAGPVLVTGATGGVGSCAVAMLAARGYPVVASSGKSEAHEWLRALGAGEVIGREELARTGRPLEEQKWVAAVDCVGGATLAGVLRSVRYGGAVAVSGLTGGNRLETTVLPFILRAVSVLGIDSVEVPIAARRALWDRIAGDLRPKDIDALVAGEVGLDGLPAVVEDLLAGRVRGRTLVRPAGA